MSTPFDDLTTEQARAVLVECLDVPRFVEEVLAGRPYASAEHVREAASRSAGTLDDVELERALARHPRIGERAQAGRHDAAHSAREQSGVDHDDEDLAARLVAGNRAYEERFDRVFLIRAAGRSGPEILAELERRLGNDEATERAETVDQLRQIALVRLEPHLA